MGGWFSPGSTSIWGREKSPPSSGRSGCGKSTLLRLLAGLERVSGGNLALAGRPLAGLNRAARVMFQDACLLPWQTVLHNVLLAAPGAEGRREARQALSRVGLLDRADEWPAALSGGQRQRVALARALASDARRCSFWTSRSGRSTR